MQCFLSKSVKPHVLFQSESSRKQSVESTSIDLLHPRYVFRIPILSVLEDFNRALDLDSEKWGNSEMKPLRSVNLVQNSCPRG